MISKLRFSLVAVIMLVLLGFGFHNQAQAQPGTDGLFCPDVPNTTGWLDVRVEAAPGLPFPNFSGALIGSVESLLGGPLHGGMDWQHVDFTSFFSPTPTNELGSQLVSWWVTDKWKKHISPGYKCNRQCGRCRNLGTCSRI